MPHFVFFANLDLLLFARRQAAKSFRTTPLCIVLLFAHQTGAFAGSNCEQAAVLRDGDLYEKITNAAEELGNLMQIQESVELEFAGNISEIRNTERMIVVLAGSHAALVSLKYALGGIANRLSKIGTVAVKRTAAGVERVSTLNEQRMKMSMDDSYSYESLAIDTGKSLISISKEFISLLSPVDIALEAVEDAQALGHNIIAAKEALDSLATARLNMDKTLRSIRFSVTLARTELSKLMEVKEQIDQNCGSKDAQSGLPTIASRRPNSVIGNQFSELVRSATAQADEKTNDVLDEFRSQTSELNQSLSYSLHEKKTQRREKSTQALNAMTAALSTSSTPASEVNSFDSNSCDGRKKGLLASAKNLQVSAQEAGSSIATNGLGSYYQCMASVLQREAHMPCDYIMAMNANNPTTLQKSCEKHLP